MNLLTGETYNIHQKNGSFLGYFSLEYKDGEDNLFDNIDENKPGLSIMNDDLENYIIKQDFIPEHLYAVFENGLKEPPLFYQCFINENNHLEFEFLNSFEDKSDKKGSYSFEQLKEYPIEHEKVFWSSILNLQVRANELEDVKCFLDNYPAMINNSNWDHGFSPLFIAIDNGNDEMVNLLLEYGANIDQVDFSKGTVLALAVWNNDEVMVDLLLKKGANINQLIENQYTILEMIENSAVKPSETIIDLLKNYAK